MTLSHEWEYCGFSAQTPLGVVESFISGFNESAAPEYYWSDLLYHYTSLKGLCGILNSRKLWASHARCLNDTSEIDYPHNLLTRVLAHLNAERRPELVERFLAELAVRTEHLPTVYVASFTKRGDRLSQWDRYAPEGYSLGFQTFLPSSVLLLKVEYNPERQEAWLEERIGRLVGVLTWVAETGRCAEERERSLEACLRFAPGSIWVSLLGIKAPAFDDEEEWRMCYHEPALDEGRSTYPINHRAGRACHVPYVELPLSEPGRDPARLKEVVVAPGHGAARRRQQAEERMRKYGAVHTVIRDSAIPRK